MEYLDLLPALSRHLGLCRPGLWKGGVEGDFAWEAANEELSQAQM